MGPRRINLDDEQNARWGLGYDKKKYDGIYAYRNSNTIYFDERKKLDDALDEVTKSLDKLQHKYEVDMFIVEADDE